MLGYVLRYAERKRVPIHKSREEEKKIEFSIQKKSAVNRLLAVTRFDCYATINKKNSVFVVSSSSPKRESKTDRQREGEGEGKRARAYTAVIII